MVDVIVIIKTIDDNDRAYFFGVNVSLNTIPSYDDKELLMEIINTNTKFICDGVVGVVHNGNTIWRDDGELSEMTIDGDVNNLSKDDVIEMLT